MPDYISEHFTGHVHEEFPTNVLQSGRVVHWLVLDGPVDSGLSEALVLLTAVEGMTLGNGEKLNLPPSCKIIVEALTLNNATPSAEWSSMIHCNKETLSSSALVDSWLERACVQHNLSAPW